MLIDNIIEDMRFPHNPYKKRTMVIMSWYCDAIKKQCSQKMIDGPNLKVNDMIFFFFY